MSGRFPSYTWQLNLAAFLSEKGGMIIFERALPIEGIISFQILRNYQLLDEVELDIEVCYL